MPVAVVPGRRLDDADRQLGRVAEYLAPRNVLVNTCREVDLAIVGSDRRALPRAGGSLVPATFQSGRVRRPGPGRDVAVGTGRERVAGAGRDSPGLRPGTDGSELS